LLKKGYYGEKNNPKCQECKSFNTIKKAGRNGYKRYYCKACGAWFKINHTVKESPLWIYHVDGTPFRKLGDQLGYSAGKQVFLKVQTEINQLPQNWQLTKDLCDPKRFCGRLVIDGKYVRVQGFEKKIPFIYAIDYLTHDIVHGDLFPAEDEAAFSQFFQKLYDLGYELEVVIADDRGGLKQALLKVFPYAKLQLCQNHYVENIRSDLNIRTSDKYHHFFNSLIKHIFEAPEDKITEGLVHVFRNRARSSRMLQNIVTTIKARQADLFSYLKFKDCPNTTNIIESYNSHFQGRLKSIRSFQSFETARRWLNAYIIRRRTKKFTDCKGKFKKLNKHAALELTIKKQARWPGILRNLGINEVKYFDFEENFPEKTDPQEPKR
jgi:hypothetical protein